MTTEQFIYASILMILLPWAIYQGIKLGRFAYLKGEDLFNKSKSKERIDGDRKGKT